MSIRLENPSNLLQAGYSKAIQDLHLAASIPAYARTLGIRPFVWQDVVLSDTWNFIAIAGARQSGKSFVVYIVPTHTAKYHPGSLSLILAATETKAGLDMKKVKDYMSRDPSYPEMVRSSDSEIQLANKSWIAVVPATERSARGYSGPAVVIADEGSRIEEEVYVSGIIPFFTDNPDGVFYNISSPNGRSNFFARAMSSDDWSRYVIRAPWEVDDMQWRLEPFEVEPWVRRMNNAGINAYTSPRHENLAEQQRNLTQMGPLMYRQEYLAEFVEAADQVFKNDDIDYAFRENDVKPLMENAIGDGGRALFGSGF